MSSFRGSLLLFMLPFSGWRIASPSVVVDATPQLKQVHVVTRHGARTPLPKDGDTLLEEAGSTLTPTGQKQLYGVGTWLRQVYNFDNFLEYYDPSEVRFESSDLDRTLSSASALTLGLFPFNAQAGNHGEVLYQSILPEMPGLPVYSMRESNDIYLRPYHRNCPTFLKRLEVLYEGDNWKDIEASNKELLTKIANLFPEDFDDGDNNPDNNPIVNGQIVLKQLWTYFDSINVARVECTPDPTVYACTSLGSSISQLRDALTDVEYNETEFLMSTTEAIKFGVGTAGNLLGSPLLWKMLNRIEDSPGAKFFLYSAHAATILGLFSAIQESPENERHPDYGSAVIMEVYEDSANDNELSIRFLYKAASESTALYIPMTRLDCETPFTGDSPPSTGGFDNEQRHCRLADFITWATANTLKETEDWCEACANESADVCLQLRLQETSPFKGALEDFESAVESDQDKALIIAGTFFGGLIAGFIIMGAGCCLSRKAAAAPSTSNENVNPKEKVKEGMPEQKEDAENGHRPPPNEVETAPPGWNAEIN